MPDQTMLVYITLALFVIGLLLILVSLRLLRRSRTDAFWRRRREAGQRGFRLFLLGFGLFVLSGFGCGLSLMLMIFSTDEADESPTATAAVIAGVGSVPSVTPTVTSDSDVRSLTPVPDESMTPITTVVIVTATPGATPTETQFATFTPNASPVISSVTPEPDAQIVITALDDQISDTLEPINPRTLFQAGTTRIYLFVEFRSMTQGVLWKRLLYRDGELIDGNTYLWGSEPEGQSYFFFGNDSGFEPGAYEVRVYIGESASPVSVMPFTIVEPSS